MVDGETAAREALKRVLSYEGYDVKTASNGEEARLAASESLPDVVTLEVRSSNASSLETLGHLHSRLPGVPVVVLSEFPGDRMLVKSMRLGAWDYVRRPFEARELLEVLSDAISESRQERWRDL